ncbi:hypothetical protein GLAREA_03232 [Glarea lozoyensis ATCC 20868]|uniref:Uncharacterized protein n=1 Tax=Glarea lozoyensis (strain ATCC 20868 / MF5171) TaxID=1116229 RepID=S3CLH2_GLAL2|nr:uncharacterized protein GLAREA_03232 [Glarea lozoyensis ATCC 20868]EPE27317.1 hypothetical protein GLAREA_03232 [Glarea lozoyensis ATCC 20868]
MASSAALIPRFLLPRQGAIWLRASSVRNASNKASSASKKVPKKASSPPAAAGKPSSAAGKPLVLEKPTHFRPPSHGQRRVKEAPRYPGPKLSEEEEAARKTRKYPNMMPAEGTFMHWFINNKSIHLTITLGTLFTLATTVYFNNLKRSSPYADLLPGLSDVFFHPIQSTRTFGEVIRLTGDYNTIQTMERRKAKVEDVTKRDAYRKAHGLDKDEGFGGWTARAAGEEMGGGLRVPDEKPKVAEVAVDGKAQTEDEKKILNLGGGKLMLPDGTIVLEKAYTAEPVVEKKPLRKWLGIW